VTVVSNIPFPEAVKLEPKTGGLGTIDVEVIVALLAAVPQSLNTTGSSAEVARTSVKKRAMVNFEFIYLGLGDFLKERL
jgi:hypothetical protein